jgi:uncharacterized protein YeaO (DUF488 family)
VLKIKRAYERRSEDDGRRIYVDRLWPRGLSKEQFIFDEWLKELSPSAELRKWYGHTPERFPEFRQRYIAELAEAPRTAELRRLAGMARTGTVTLVYSARDTERNNAVVLVGLINRLMGDTTHS